MMAKTINSYNKWKTLHTMFIFLIIALLVGATLFIYYKYNKDNYDDILEEKINRIHKSINKVIGEHENRLNNLHNQINF